MTEVSIVGVDLAKQAFQLHAAARDGMVVFRRKLSRSKFVEVMAKLPRCVVAMEACATAHYWGRVLGAQGHEVRLIPPVYVKPFVKRQKNDAADAEALSRRRSGRRCGRSLSNPPISRRAPCCSAPGKC